MVSRTTFKHEKYTENLGFGRVWAYPYYTVRIA